MNKKDIMIREVNEKQSKTLTIECKTVGKVNNKLTTLNEIEEDILKTIRKDPNLRQIEIAEEVWTSEKTVQRHMHNLKEKGLIKRIGSSRKGYWEITGV